MTHRNSALFRPQTPRVEPLVWVLFIFGLGGAWSPSVQAQIIPDQTLGHESSIVTTDHIQGLNSARISGGAIRANVLFHSFEDFNVAEGKGAYFSSPVGISNILSRVTGNSPSDIIGRLGVLGNANLFLLNPNGIVFGPHSSLDVNGSFMASTADQFTFENGQTFSALNPKAAPLLSINVPMGLQYGSSSSGSIINAGDLAVDPGHALTLTGASVFNTGSLTAQGGEVAIAAIPQTQPNTSSHIGHHIQLGPNGQLLAIQTEDLLSGPLPSAAPSVFELLTSRSENLGFSIESTGESTGQIITAYGTPIPTEMITEAGHTLITGTLDTATAVPGRIGGQVTVVGDRVTLIDQADVDVSGHSGGGIAYLGGGYQGNGIGLNAETTIVGGNVVIEANAIATGQGGEAIVWADGTTQFHGSAFAQGGMQGGDGGLVEVSGKQALQFLGHANLSAPQGEPGTLLLDPTNITIVDAGGANDDDISDTDGTILASDGAGSTFTISEETLEDLAADTNIELQATNDITIADLTTDEELAFSEASIDGASGVAFIADADEDGVGNFVMSNTANRILTRGRNITISGATITPGIINSEGGDIELTASDSINLRAGVSLHSGDFAGNTFTDFSGDITLTATNDITVTNAFISATGNGGAGNSLQDSGSIRLETTTGSINLSNAQLSSETLGQGLAGNINLISGDRLIIRNDSTLASGSDNGFTATGDAAGAGLIDLNASNTIRISQSDISAESAGVGEAAEQGEISIVSRDGSIRLLRGSAVSTRTEGSGFAGPITLSALNGTLRLQNSSIQSDFRGSFTEDGGAGEIELISKGDIRLQRSQISASSFSTDTTEDTSGSIALQSSNQNIILRDSRVATTTTSNGVAGEISLEAPQGNIELIGNGDTDREGVFTDADQGIAGAIGITANTLQIERGAQVSARTKTGTAGNININQAEDDTSTASTTPMDRLMVRGDNSRITARARRNGGEAGFISINAQNLVIEDRAFVEASSRSSNATAVDSAVRLQNVETLALAGGGQLNVETARGKAGNVEINLNGLPVRQLYLDGESSRISARATARGGASGTVAIHAQDIQIQNGARITAANRRNPSDDNSSNPSSLSELLLDDVTSLQVLSGGQVSVRTRTGTAGNVEINRNSNQPLETLIVDGRGSRITARAIGGGGDAGRVAIHGRNVTVSDRAQITAANVDSEDTTNIDNIVLEQVETLEVRSRGEISVLTDSGVAGNVEINQNSSNPVTTLVVDGNESLITAQALRPGGSAGRVAINAQNILVNNLGRITAENLEDRDTNPAPDSALQFTNVEILEVLDGGQISVLTRRGTAGNIAIDRGALASSPSVRVEGGGSEITAQATGQGDTALTAGNITINTGDLTVKDGGSITVSSPNGVAGNLELNIPVIVLDDGQLRAEIGSNEAVDTGAEINFSGLVSLLMRNNSLVSASAANGATGGNLTFGSLQNPVVFIGAPTNNNSDIIATAQQGRGGNITLRAEQVEGFTVQNTPFVRNNLTNDISASSAGGPQGTIVFETPSVNPLQSLTNLPGVLIDLPPFASLCSRQGQGQSEFVQVGRGGLPSHPEDVLGPGGTSVPWVSREVTDEAQDVNLANDSHVNAAHVNAAHVNVVNPAIVEIQGWTTDAQGNLVLTAQAPHATPDASGAIVQDHCPS